MLTGDPSSQTAGNASQIIDLALGFLGVGQLDGLADGRGLLSLRYTQLDEITPADVVRKPNGVDTQLFMVTGQSLVWDGTDRFGSAAWSLEDTPTPGEYEA